MLPCWRLALWMKPRQKERLLARLEELGWVDFFYFVKPTDTFDVMVVAQIDGKAELDTLMHRPLAGVRVVDYSTLMEELKGYTSMDHGEAVLNLLGMEGLSLSKKIYRLTKRLVARTFGLFLYVMTAPLALVAGSEINKRQWFMGADFEPFWLYAVEPNFSLGDQFKFLNLLSLRLAEGKLRFIGPRLKRITDLNIGRVAPGEIWNLYGTPGMFFPRKIERLAGWKAELFVLSREGLFTDLKIFQVFFREFFARSNSKKNLIPIK